MADGSAMTDGNAATGDGAAMTQPSHEDDR